MKIVAVVIFTPRWASADTTGDDYYLYPPTNFKIGNYSSSLGTVGTGYDYLFKFAKKISSRYSDVIEYWEFWNEPDVINGFLYDFDNDGSTANEYAKMLEYFYHGIKEGNASAKVLLGGLANSSLEDNCDINFAEAILNNQFYPAKDNFDIFNFHVNFKSPEEILSDIDKFSNLLNQYSIGSKPMWITESSYSPIQRFQNVENYQNGEVSFNNYVRDVLSLEINSKVQAAFWAVLFDYPDSTEDDFPYKFSGLFTNDLREKDAAEIFKNIQSSFDK